MVQRADFFYLQLTTTELYKACVCISANVLSLAAFIVLQLLRRQISESSELGLEQ